MAAKRIILLLDGTWNDADLGASDTNIVRMREIIAHSLDVRSTVIPPGTNALTASSDQKVGQNIPKLRTSSVLRARRGNRTSTRPYQGRLFR